MSDSSKPARPVYRNIHITQIATYRMPMAAYVSIMHRVSGLLMFLMLPVLLFLLEKSLLSEVGFGDFKSYLANPLVKLVLLALVWAYLHHALAGFRHLLMDKHIGLDKEQARNSAVAVFAVSLPLTALIGLKLFGVF